MIALTASRMMSMPRLVATTCRMKAPYGELPRPADESPLKDAGGSSTGPSTDVGCCGPWKMSGRSGASATGGGGAGG